MSLKKWLKVSFSLNFSIDIYGFSCPLFSHLLYCYYTGLHEFKGKAKPRAKHKAPVIGDSLYLWGGDQLDLPRVHDSPQKKQLVSSVEVFSFSTGQWSSQLTRGTPPQGVMGYSCTTSHSNIYYYGGWCGHDDCHYNSLNVLNTLNMNWTLVQPNNDSMMKKAYGGMMSLDFAKTEYLFIVGGVGSTPTVHHPQFQYVQRNNGRVLTNEQLLYNLSTGKHLVSTMNLCLHF